MVEKKVDESWKVQVEREKAVPQKASSGSAQPSARGSESPSGLRTEFGEFLSTLAMQAIGALEQDLEQARYLIDVLGVLQQKTQGNLTSEEGQLLEGALYELRMKYVAKINPPQPAGGK